MRSVLKFMLAALLAVLAGCATGPKFSEVATTFPPLAAGEARVFFYRDSIVGAAFSPDVRIDSRVIAPMKANSFFFVDVPAGKHTASASTEVDANLDFNAKEGETVYINMSIGIGLVVGRPHLTQRTASEATRALATLSYAGGKPLPAGRSASSAGAKRAPPAAETPRAQAPSSRRAEGSVDLDDLRGLMPATR